MNKVKRLVCTMSLTNTFTIVDSANAIRAHADVKIRQARSRVLSLIKYRELGFSEVWWVLRVVFSV